MKKYSDGLSRIFMLIGVLAIIASISASEIGNIAPFLFGVVPLILGLYMRINNHAREEMLKNIIILNSTPENEKQKVIKLLKEPKKTSLLIKLILFALIVIVFVLIVVIIFLLFDITIRFNPGKIQSILDKINSGSY